MSTGNATDNNPLGNLTSFEGSVVVAAIPTGAMILGSLLVVYCRPSELVKASLQNLSAGIILAAIAGELFPVLTVPEDGDAGLTCLAISIGFVAGAGLMFSLGAVLEKCEQSEGDDDDDDVESVDGRTNRSPAQSRSMEEGLLQNGLSHTSEFHGLNNKLKETLLAHFGDVNQCLGQIEVLRDRTEIDFVIHRISACIDDCRRQIAREPTSLSEAEHEELFRPLRETRKLLEHVEKSHHSDKFTSSFLKHLDQLEESMSGFHYKVETHHSKGRRWSIVLKRPRAESEDQPVKPARLPWSLVLAVSVDALVDGFLIGLSYIANWHAGFVMAGATCVEMGFLGVSYCASLLATRRPLIQVVWLVLLPPFTLLLGGFLAGIIGTAIEGTEVFVGFIALAVVALFFLVTQELLIEANENLGGKDIPWINLMLFVGILLVIIVQNLVG